MRRRNRLEFRRYPSTKAIPRALRRTGLCLVMTGEAVV